MDAADLHPFEGPPPATAAPATAAAGSNLLSDLMRERRRQQMERLRDLSARFVESSARRLDACLDHIAGLTDAAEKRRCTDMYKHLASKQREALALATREAEDEFEREYRMCARAFGIYIGYIIGGGGGCGTNGGGDEDAGGGDRTRGDDGGGGGSDEEEDEEEDEVPTEAQKEEFRRTVRAYFGVGDQEKELRKKTAELGAVRRKMEEAIVAFMRRFRIDDVETREGKLRCVTRAAKRNPTRADLEARIAAFFGEDVTTAEALRGNLFEAKGVSERTTLRRLGLSASAAARAMLAGVAGQPRAV